MERRSQQAERSRGEASRRDKARPVSRRVLLGLLGTPALPMFLQANQFPSVPKLIQIGFLSFAIRSTD